MARKPNPDLDDNVQTDFVARPSNAARVPPPAQRDTSLAEVLVLAHCMPVGVIQEQRQDELGEPVYDDVGNPLLDVVERRLSFRERVHMQRWCAEIMAQREHVEIL